MSPMRKFTQMLKNLISRNPSLMAIFVFLKCFLRHGYTEAIVKYRLCKPVKIKNAEFLHTITTERRKREEAYEFPQKIKISILVPLYNTPKQFLVEMIKSVTDQTYKNWELCLADGSDDEHAFVGEYCQSLAKDDSRIVYKKLEKNEGISENTNVCIKMASGEYIALFDHDDVLHPSALFEAMKAICEHGAEYVYTDEATFAGENLNDIITYHFKPDFAPDNLLANNYI
ncbi:MAG: glycosyltransferase, partial [Oscillospiraceae bacterium]|nr:glycosyltransferase [Oscillospiraceae bacterium]